MITLNDDNGAGRAEDDPLQNARHLATDERKLIGVLPAVIVDVGLILYQKIAIEERERRV